MSATVVLPHAGRLRRADELRRRRWDELERRRVERLERSRPAPPARRKRSFRIPGDLVVASVPVCSYLPERLSFLATTASRPVRPVGMNLRWRLRVVVLEGWAKLILCPPTCAAIKVLRMGFSGSVFEPYQVSATGSTSIGAFGPPEYVVSVAAGTTTATSSVAGNPNFSSSDAGAVLQSVMNQLANAGTVWFTAGAYTWSTIPKIPRNFASAGSMNKNYLRLLAGGGATIALSTVGCRFLDFNRIADYDSFANVEVGGFVVDATSQPATGNNHVIIGTCSGGSGETLQRVNFYNFWVHDCKTINVATIKGGVSNNAHFNIWVENSQLAANEGTNNYILNFLVERVRMEGGDGGIIIGSAGANNGLRCYGGGIKFVDCWHSALSTPTAGYVAANYEIGGSMASYSSVVVDSNEPNSADLLVQRCYGYGSGDVGFAPENLATMNFIDCVCEDAWNEGYTPANFNFVNGIDTSSNQRQKIIFIRCTHRATNNVQANGNYGWELDGASTTDCGSYELLDCSFHCTTLVLGTGNLKLAFYHKPSTASRYHRVRIENFTACYDSITNATVTDGNVNVFLFNGNGPCELILRDLSIITNGSRSSTGQIFLFPLDIYGKDYRLTLDGLSLEDNITGRANDTTQYVRIGPSQFTAGTNAGTRGSVRNVRCIAAASDTQPRGVVCFSTATSTITGTLQVQLVDFFAVPNASLRLNVDATQQSKVSFMSDIVIRSSVGSDVTTSSNVQANVTSIAFQLGANETWTFEIQLDVVGTGTGGTKFQFTGPVGATIVGQALGDTTAITAVDSEIVTALSTAFPAATAYCQAITGIVWIKGRVINGGTAGTIQLQVASATNGQSNTVKAGSYMEARQIA